MKKTSMLFALAAVVGAAAVSQAAVVTTVTRSVGSELVAAAGTSGIPANAASAIYELGSGQSFSIGGTFTVKLTNARFVTGTTLAICNGTSVLASNASTSTAGAQNITLTAAQIVPAFTAYQLFTGTNAAGACNGGSVGLPVEINGTDPVQVAIDSTDVPAATAPAVDLYKTQKQFTAALTFPASAVIDFNAIPANSLLVANATATPPVTTTSVPAGYVVYSNQTLDMKLDVNGTSLANNACVAGAAFGTSYMNGTSAVAIPGGGPVNIATTVKGTFTELALSGTSAAAGPVSFGIGASTSAPVITFAGPVVASTSTSATSGTSLTGVNVNICGAAATGSSAAATLNDVVLNKVTGTSIALLPRTFTTGVDIAVGTSKIFTLIPDTTSHSIVLNTTRYFAPTVKSSSTDANVQSWFKLQLVKTAAASTAKVNVQVLLADGTYYTLNNFKTLTAGVTSAFSSKEIVDAVAAAGKTLPMIGDNYTFAAIVEVEAMNDNLYAYASMPNNATGSYTRIPLRILQGGAVPAAMSVW